MMSKPTTLHATIWDDADEAIVATGRFTPACKGARDAFGVPQEPDDEADIEILDAVDQQGTTRNLSSGERAKAYDALWAAVAANA